jgi:hypothetical protein
MEARFMQFVFVFVSWFSRLALTLLVVSSAHCTWTTELPSNAATIPIVRNRELVVTDDTTLGSLSGNSADEPLSFRHLVEHLPTAGTSGDAVLTWMSAWSKQLRDEGSPARADILDAAVTCRWLRRNPGNQCSPSCETCATRVLRLQDAPFRLVAVANRTDLSVMPDRAADGGEGRLVFALTDDAADSENSSPQPLTVIVEYAQEGSAKDWAARWHSLGSATDNAFPGQLAALVATFTDTGRLAQIRTGDALTGPLVLHEFHLQSGALVASTVRNTPDWSVVKEADVRAFCANNADALANGTHVFPASWLATSSALGDEGPSYLAMVPNHDALVQGTCGGCHHEATTGFQINPLAKGDAKLSNFLVDPSKPLDEIGRRTEWMQLTLAQ